MASVFKSKGAEKWMINYTDEFGKRRKKAGYTDSETERYAMRLKSAAGQDSQWRHQPRKRSLSRP